MSDKDLRADYQRLAEHAAEVLSGQEPIPEDRLRPLLERFRILTEAYDQKLLEAQAEIAALKRELFGPKADRLTPEQQDQLNQLLADMEAESQQPAPDADSVLEEEETQKRSKRKRRTRHPLPVEMETETVTIEPDLPLSLLRQNAGPHWRRSFRGNRPHSGTADPPQNRASQVCLPLRRSWRRRGGLASTSDSSKQAGSGARRVYRPGPIRRSPVLLPARTAIPRAPRRRDPPPADGPVDRTHCQLAPALVERMWQAMCASGYLQVDETPVKVLDPDVKGKAAQGYLWFYAVPGGDVFIEFDSSRGLEPVRRRLTGFAGTIQTDAYEVYESLSRKESAIARIGCLAHARRYLYKALKESFAEAVWFITQIRSLYRIEDKIRELPSAQRYDQRRQQAPEIWNAMKARATELQPTLLPQSTMGKALNYFLNEYDALTGYLEDGRFEIDNNLVENSIRPTAVGRKRWLFIGHPDAGWRSAVLYSLLVSCRRRGINPNDYLTDVLRRLPHATVSELDSLLPANWTPHPD